MASQDAARVRPLKVEKFQDNNGATSLFEPAGGSIFTGSTNTNVNDFRAVSIEP
jgi:glycerate-2-kinase